ncbi:MAG: 50S ribosomal protein L23 [Bacteroides sp.]|nr:50S ribosomal protein L23 [Bacteroidales bacterium]MBD5292347.1 50S ribosomal protein L23 [Bacteroides sp.]MBD5337819.1 50S ribosomal protein L23 [Bacteroides sp.]MDE6806714.1 50S ribosomal protein L23 [Muribaculaceae bacterium]MDE7510019.1 50S ribosomal protein L23 [Muribaculaceae bacterium]
MKIDIRPIMTEKATAASEKLNCYTFAVSPDANKFQIKDIVEKLYNVRVVSVNTDNYAGKRVQRYTKAGLLRGRKPAYKKAYVTVAEGQTIDYYSNI